MTDPTSDTNPTGVRAMDHRHIAKLPEYHAARRAVDDLVKAIQTMVVEGDLAAHSQSDWIDVVSDFARSNAYADGCDRTGCPGSRVLDPVWPIRITIDSPTWLTAYYRCTLCENSWKTGWAIDLPDL